MARGNRQWKHFESGIDSLAIFQGPHAYISPSWYETELSVPTWNYAVVHAYGKARLTDDSGLRAILRDTVQQHEADRDTPWTMDRLPVEFVDKLATAIIGVEIEITRLEGKFKMSQNRSDEDKQGVVNGLRRSPYPLDIEVANWMSESL